jgi:hypothetical protein
VNSLAAGQTEPALLHFEEALTKLRVRLEPGLYLRNVRRTDGTRSLPYSRLQTWRPSQSAPTSQFSCNFALT